MSLFTDLLLSALESAASPSTPRGLVGTLAAVSAGFAVLTLWLLLTHPEPLAHRWGIGAYAGSLAIGGSGLLAATLHLSREAADRAFGAVCLAANASAIIVAVYGIVAR